ncbi:5-(carboxyamino)imidazole ribonucleotide mutase [Bdellovibrio sp. 22V]|uniref:AIR carboxylase family protein n=1 Tax=Bdellovibrio TaxID=958 RepID=UPI002543E991|nr:AIR carboxylase family protein [Bdellovibrio sp. 22V]WII73217.1 5-(carboxyamino)imidazole ribonucleotide mutase [Bdellovibrio sp. 22V]
MKIQVMFGSPSDERVYGPLCRSLEKCGDVKMEVASAHRHPDKVREIVQTCGADVFVAGAGLAAHLPGVVASLTTKPVFGVAVNGAFAGLDSFLSIVQMPKGVPVMAVTEENASTIADLLLRWKSLPADKIYLHWNRNLETYSPIQKAIEDIQNQSGVKVIWSEPRDSQCLGEIVSPWELPRMTGLNLFLCEKEQLTSSNLALDFFAKARHGGAWVGANNIGNFVEQWKKLVSLGGRP